MYGADIMFLTLSLCAAGIQGMPGADMYGASPGSSPYSQLPQLRTPVHSQAMLIPGHPHHMMMAAHGGHIGHPGMPTQSPPLHAGMEAMGHASIQDIHAG